MGNFPLISFCCARNDIYHKEDGKSIEDSEGDQLEPYCIQPKVKGGSDKGTKPTEKI